MELKDIMHILEDMKVGVFATLDEYGNPHARHAHITAANEEGIFFMTSPETHFYDQLMGDQRVAMTAISEEGYLIQVVRVEGTARPVENDYLKTVLRIILIINISIKMSLVIQCKYFRFMQVMVSIIVCLKGTNIFFYRLR